MKKTPAIVGTLIALLAASLAAQESKQPPPADNVPTVTYIANDGFLIEAAGKKVLVDALFNPVLKRYLAPSPETIEAMTNDEAPFADLDLILITHPHADHFDPNRVIACLRSQPRCQLLAHAETVARLRRADGFAEIERQVHEVNLDPGSVTHAVINGIAVETLCLDHSYGQERPSKNLAFVVALGGTRFCHLGDATIRQNTAHLSAYDFDANPVDLLFLSYFDRSPEAQQFIARMIKPRRIISMHVPPAELEEESRKIRAAYPYAIVFRQSMERRSLPTEVDFHHLSGDYFGQLLPGATPQVFARGIVSTDDLEHSGPCFTPDGNEVFWWENRPPGPDNKEWLSFGMTMRRENGRWSAPHASSLGGMPVFSADGRRAYFSSSRPRPSAAQEGPPNIWFVKRQGDDWSEPKCLDLVARYPELLWAGVQSITRNGTLYFMGYTPGPLNDSGIYRAELVNGEYAKPELLPRNINLPPFLNWTPFVAPDESYLLFSSNRHDPDHDAGDLYLSHRLADGSWTDPVTLGEPVNSNRQERFPLLSLDGKYLFFTRPTPGHDQDVYWVSAASIPALQATTNSPQENPK